MEKPQKNVLDFMVADVGKAYPELTAPVTGSYWGTPAHTLTTKVCVEALFLVG
ncbi:MAG: hypothetical protein ACUVRP_10445 [Chlorobiales bacterium]